jgi:DNA-binding SARP family transcriptional activator/Tfp pilus assembly protein PilF
MPRERKLFSLKLFGGCVLEGPDGPVTGRAAQRRRVACLAAIAMAGQAGASRDRLTALFWPDSSADQARHRLADTLYVLRAALGEEALVGTGERVALHGDVLACDARRFEAALAEGDVAGAAALYAGPFLDGFHVADAAEFERWADGERERLAREAARAFAGLARERAASGDHAGAADAWRRAAAQDPYSVHPALELMHALAAAGDRAGAIRHAAVHAALLREELGAEPDAAVAALAERLRGAPATRGDADARAMPDAPRPTAGEAILTPAAPEAPGFTTGPPSTPAHLVTPAVPARAAPRRRQVAALALSLAAALAALLLARVRTAPGRLATASAAPTRTAPTATAPARVRLGDPVAEDLYLRGRHYWSLDTPEDIRRGIDYFWRAVDQDPTFALAYAGLADGYARLDDMSAMPSEDARPRALAAARRAITLDSSVAEAHAALAHVLMHRLRWADAERAYRQALALDPEYATAHLWYAVHLMAVGRVDQATAEARRARALDPLSVGVNWLAGSILSNVGRHAEAVAVLDGMLERVPGHPGMRYARAMALVEVGRYAEGVAELERLGRPLPLARALALQGRTTEASRIVRAEEARPAPAASPISEHARRASEFAHAYVALGDHERALDWLEREVDSGSNMVLGVRADTRLAPLHAHPRYVRLLRRLGLG